jgi:hypothetical protein
LSIVWAGPFAGNPIKSPAERRNVSPFNTTVPFPVLGTVSKEKEEGSEERQGGDPTKSPERRNVSPSNTPVPSLI